MGLPLLLLKFVDEFEECTFIEGVPLSSVEEVFVNSLVETAICQPMRFLTVLSPGGKQVNLALSQSRQMVCWGLEAVRLHFLVIFYGEPIQNSTVQSPVTLFFLHGVNTCKGVPAGQLLLT